MSKHRAILFPKWCAIGLTLTAAVFAVAVTRVAADQELSVKQNSVDQDAQVASPDKTAATIVDTDTGLVSKTFVPPPKKGDPDDRYRFRKFRADDDEQKSEKKAAAHYAEHEYIDLILSTDWTLQPGFDEDPAAITVPVKVTEGEDANGWPITADGNLAGGGGGGGDGDAGAQADNPHWAAKVSSLTAKIVYDITGEDIPEDEKVIVGQGIQLRVVVEPADTVVDEYTWSVAGQTFVTYVAGENLGAVFGRNDPAANDERVAFRWIDGGDGRTVTCALRIAGGTLPVSVDFDVVRPQSTVEATTSPINLHEAADPDDPTKMIPYLDFGDTSPPGPFTEGIYFDGEVTIPDGFDGEVFWVQVIEDFDGKLRDANGDNYVGKYTNVLDTQYPYSEAEDASDTPGGELAEPYVLHRRNDKFKMYLMFKPTGDGIDGEPVPLKVVKWHWSATAEKANGQWELTSDPNAFSKDPDAKDALDHPTWNGLLKKPIIFEKQEDNDE